MTLLPVRAQLRARRAGAIGPWPGTRRPRLVIGVTKPPKEGRANQALPKTPDLGNGSVTLAPGATAREKTLAVAAPLAAWRARPEPFA